MLASTSSRFVSLSGAPSAAATSPGFLIIASSPRGGEWRERSRESGCGRGGAGAAACLQEREAAPEPASVDQPRLGPRQLALDVVGEEARIGVRGAAQRIAAGAEEGAARPLRKRRGFGVETHR